MKAAVPHAYPILKRIMAVSLLLGLLLIISAFLGLSMGSSEQNIRQILAVLTGHVDPDPTLSNIIWQIRFPRVVLAALVGATLSLGGL
ncbi:MAG: iron chelate uptake ABC transporter family permease subunit, partial [Syntrophobacteraceae bacterium]